jgi:hypothetical protein
MKKVFLLIMVALFATFSATQVSAQKKALKTITINVDSLGQMDGDEIYLEFKDSSGITGVTYTFSNFYTMMTPDSTSIQNGSIQFRIVKALPVKYRQILKEEVKRMEDDISKEQKRNSDRISRKQEMDTKSKIKD